METRVDEIADRIFRLSTFVPDIGPTGFTFNQFLVDADEPLLFHTGPRAMFPSVSAAIATVMPLERLRWITFGHLEADECGAMNRFLAARPDAQVAHGALGCMVSINDLADRPPRADGSRRGVRPRRQAGPQHRHPARAPRMGRARALRGDHRHAAVRRPLHPGRRRAPRSRPATSSTPPPRPKTCSAPPASRPTPRRPSAAWPISSRATLAIMHGSSYNGDCAKALLALADDYDGGERGRATVVLCAAVGTDEFGDRAIAALAAENVGVDRVARVEEPTGVALILVEESGENEIVGRGANNHADGSGFAWRRGDIAAAVLEVPTPTVEVFFAEARAAEATTFLNAAPATGDAAPVIALVRRGVRERARTRVTGGAVGGAAFVVTLGPRGVRVVDRHGELSLPAHAVDVIDTVGAGDATCGVLAAGLAEGLSLRDSAVRANAAGAMTVRAAGARTSPTANEIDEFLGRER